MTQVMCAECSVRIVEADMSPMPRWAEGLRAKQGKQITDRTDPTKTTPQGGDVRADTMRPVDRRLYKDHTDHGVHVRLCPQASWY